MRVVKPGSPSIMDPTEKVESTVESMTIQQYEAELWRKELQQVRTALCTPLRPWHFVRGYHHVACCTS